MTTRNTANPPLYRISWTIAPSSHNSYTWSATTSEITRDDPTDFRRQHTAREAIDAIMYQFREDVQRWHNEFYDRTASIHGLQNLLQHIYYEQSIIDFRNTWTGSERDLEAALDQMEVRRAAEAAEAADVTEAADAAESRASETPDNMITLPTHN